MYNEIYYCKLYASYLHSMQKEEPQIKGLQWCGWLFVWASLGMKNNSKKSCMSTIFYEIAASQGQARVYYMNWQVFAMQLYCNWLKDFSAKISYLYYQKKFKSRLSCKGTPHIMSCIVCYVLFLLLVYVRRMLN